jgi:hypothetical protein
MVRYLNLVDLLISHQEQRRIIHRNLFGKLQARCRIRKPLIIERIRMGSTGQRTSQLFKGISWLNDWEPWI